MTSHHHLKDFGDFGESYTRELLESMGVVVTNSCRADLKLGGVEG